MALAFTALLGFVGFVVDTGLLYLHRVWLGQAVDAAALAGGFELPNLKAACARAVEQLEVNSYVAGNDLNYQIIFPSQPDAPGGDPGEIAFDSVTNSISSPGDCASLTVPASHENVHYSIEVSANQTIPTAFMGLFGFDTIGVGVPGESKRSARYDVALVLDTSGSMKFDTCNWYRPEDQYACQNRFAQCTVFLEEDFEDYSNNSQLEAGGWNINAGVDLRTSGGHDGPHKVRMTNTSGSDGEMWRAIDTSGSGELSLTFWARDVNMKKKDKLKVYWRLDSGSGWSKILEVKGKNLGSSWEQLSVYLPSAASNNPDFALRFLADVSSGRRLEIDDIQLRSCSEQPGPWVWYYWSYYNGCRPDRPMTCDDLAPETLIPAISYDQNEPPMAQLMEQPMLDVLLASQTFIEILDARRVPDQPPEDQLGLVTFESSAHNLHSLTTDFDAVESALFASIRSNGGTNIGAGIRVGLSILGSGRANSTHFMVLLTDGWPNFYDTPYSNPTSFTRRCSTNDPCQQTLEYIDAQIASAQEQNVTIFTIGLGEDLNTETFDASSAYGPGATNFSGMDLLERISTNTGGTAYHSPNSDDLEQIFSWIAQAIFVRLTQ